MLFFICSKALKEQKNLSQNLVFCERFYNQETNVYNKIIFIVSLFFGYVNTQNFTNYDVQLYVFKHFEQNVVKKLHILL